MNKVLYKLAENGTKIQYWEIQLEGYRYRTVEGYAGGAMTESTWTYAEGKNIGKANETTRDAQAALEVQSKITKKRDEGYGDSVEEVLDSIFEDNSEKWKGKYSLIYCDLCEVWSVSCQKCQTSSCSGGVSQDGCNCLKDFEEFYNFKQPLDYLNSDELSIFEKARRLKKMTKQSYLAGFSEINWEYLGTNGKCSENDGKYFPELKNYTYNPQ